MLQLDLFTNKSVYRKIEYPVIPNNAVVAIDTETRDENLLSSGPGWRTNEAYSVGLGVAFRQDSGEIWKGYFAYRHAFDNTHGVGGTLDWLSEQISTGDRTFVYANAQYDIGTLSVDAVPCPLRAADICILESLIEEEHPDGFSLDALSRRYLNRRKEETELEERARNYGYRNTKGSIWKMPGLDVAKYGETDPELTLLIYEKQLEELKRQKLEQAADIENRLIPLVHRMTKRGIPVDIEYAARLNEKWEAKERELLLAVGAGEGDAGRSNIITNDWLVREFGKRGLPTETTVKGRASIKKHLLEKLSRTDPWVKTLMDVRTLSKIRRDYLCGSLLSRSHRGRVHPEFIQRARDDESDDEGTNGTRTGRFSCRNPNIQQIPKRFSCEHFKAKDLRPCLCVHKDDGNLWAKFDYNSQEPRMQVHYGLMLDLPGAREVADGFSRGIKLYTTLEQLMPELNYDQHKQVVLGRSYGMGVAKMAMNLGLSEERCAEVLKLFDEKVGYIGLTANRADKSAAERGFIVSLFGQRRHFNTWEINRFSRQEKTIRFLADNPAEAKRRIFGELNARGQWLGLDIRRSDTRKAYNALIQGGCSMQTKKAMLDAWEAERLVPYMTVHDEVNWPVEDEPTAHRCKGYMENAVNFLLPMRSDMDLGSAWC